MKNSNSSNWALKKTQILKIIETPDRYKSQFENTRMRTDKSNCSELQVLSGKISDGGLKRSEIKRRWKFNVEILTPFDVEMI